MTNWTEQLEPGEYRQISAMDSMANKAIISIAISLKRLADLKERAVVKAWWQDTSLDVKPKSEPPEH